MLYAGKTPVYSPQICIAAQRCGQRRSYALVLATAGLFQVCEFKGWPRRASLWRRQLSMRACGAKIKRQLPGDRERDADIQRERPGCSRPSKTLYGGGRGYGQGRGYKYPHEYPQTMWRRNTRRRKSGLPAFFKRGEAKIRKRWRRWGRGRRPV
jgi:hypothetical protein